MSPIVSCLASAFTAHPTAGRPFVAGLTPPTPDVGRLSAPGHTG
ncbi:hypothetical protein [Brevibacterium siliguriense]|nr:hypothetical protein [Brevibacterium siliguriense]